jgi:hypothetical protein
MNRTATLHAKASANIMRAPGHQEDQSAGLRLGIRTNSVRSFSSDLSVLQEDLFEGLFVIVMSGLLVGRHVPAEVGLRVELTDRNGGQGIIAAVSVNSAAVKRSGLVFLRYLFGSAPLISLYRHIHLVQNQLTVLYLGMIQASALSKTRFFFPPAVLCI